MRHGVCQRQPDRRQMACHVCSARAADWQACLLCLPGLLRAGTLRESLLWSWVRARPGLGGSGWAVVEGVNAGVHGYMNT